MKKKRNFKQIKSSLQIFKFLKPYKWIYFLGLFCLLVSSLSAILFPYLLGGLLGVDRSLKKDQFEITDINNIDSLFILLLVLFCIQSIASFFRIQLFGVVTENSLRDIRESTFNKLIAMPIVFYDKQKVGELQSRVSADVTLLSETFNTTLAEFLRQILTILFGIIFITIISWKLSLIMLGIIPVISVIAVIFGKYIKKISKKTQDATASSNNILLESLSGIKNVKAFVNEKFEFGKFKIATNNINKLGKKNATWRGLFASFIILVMFGSIIFVIWNGMKMVNQNQLKPAEFFQFLLYTIMIGASFGGVSSLLGNIQKAIGATERLLELINLKSEENTNQSKKNINSDNWKGDIEFKNVNFFYESRPEINILDEFNVKIPNGKQTAIVGQSGSGKSTIAQLLLHFYQPQSGEILIDNINYNDYDLYEYRSKIGVVAQETFLFGGTIYDNIAYGQPNASKKEVIKAAKMANVHEFSEKFPEKLKTLVGDRGIQLSGGQKQRIAIARAILKNPSILILDEATSSLDNNTEKIVQEALEQLLSNRTSIVIAHRLSSVINADNIIVLEKGKIIESGTHDELFNKKGHYNKLYTNQLSENKINKD